MAKAASLKIKLLSTADTGYFYVTSKNARTKTEKLTFKKYDPGRAQACRVQGNQDQVSGPPAYEVKGRLRAPFVFRSGACNLGALRRRASMRQLFASSKVLLLDMASTFFFLAFSC